MTTDKKKLRELAGAATPGEWSVEKNCVYTLIHDGWKKGVEQFRNFLTITCYISKQGDHGKEENANAAFIAAANPQAVIELLDEVERLRGALEEARNIIQHYFDHTKTIPLSGIRGVARSWLIRNVKKIKPHSNTEEESCASCPKDADCVDYGIGGYYCPDKALSNPDDAEVG